MIRLTSVIFAIGLALLAGCAGIKQNAGLNVQLKSRLVLQAREEPWHNVTLRGDLRQLEKIAVAVVNLPRPLPTHWKEEFVDKGRTYPVKLDGRLFDKPLERVVFRAAAYTEAGRFVEVFDAVVTPYAQALLIILPADRVEEVKGYRFALLPSDASWLMTTQGEKVVLEKGQDLERLPPGFFEEHPSPLRQVIVIERTHRVFRDLLEMFPYHFKFNDVPYSGRPRAETRAILGAFTDLTGVLDRGISCGSATITSGPAAPIVAGISVARTLYVMSQEDCLAGK